MNEENIIKGEIEGFNKNGDMPAGIKVGGVWYNATENSEEAVMGLKDKKGCMMEIHLVTNTTKIFGVKVTGTKTKGESNAYQDGARIGMSMNCATRLVIAKMKPDSIPQEELAEAVVSLAKEILLAMDEAGLK